MVNVRASCSSAGYGTLTSDQQPLPVLARSPVILLSELLLSSWCTEETQHLSRMGPQAPQHWAMSGMGMGSSTFPRTAENHFSGSSRAFKLWVDQGGEMTKFMFSVVNLLMCMEKHGGRDGRQHCDAHVITQASKFWLLLCPRERHKHRKAENS